MKPEISKLKNKKGILRSNREKMLNIVKGFYFELHQSQLDEKLDPHSLPSGKCIINPGFGELPEIIIDKIWLVLKKVKNNNASSADNVVTDARCNKNRRLTYV